MAGHLFIVRGDLGRVSCDAWLVPADGSGHVATRWLPDLTLRGVEPLDPEDGWFRAPVDESWRQGATRVRRLTELALPAEDPVPWLVNTGGLGDEGPEWLAVAARAFVAEASVGARGQVRRAKPVLALPVIGTGQGGFSRLKGEVLPVLIRELIGAAADEDVDVVLVALEERMYLAAQQVRRQAGDEPWAELALFEEPLHRLAGRAREQRLVLFIGAGVSAGAGLPDWAGLLEMLGEEADLNEEELNEIATLPAPDAARVVQRRLEAKGRELGPAVRQVLGRPRRYGLGHALLLGLPAEEVVTTNYDRLFEDAVASIREDLDVLPVRTGAGRWLLKLHGDIESPDDIVLTRADYLRYGSDRSALAGIVQALLMTRHMLFVGFGLRDDNFHRVIDEVRRATARSEASGPFGTALLPHSSVLLDDLWSPEIQCLQIGRGHEVQEGIRLVEMFLDRLGALTATVSAHALQPDYEALLSDRDRVLAARLNDLWRDRQSFEGAVAWSEVKELLRSMGAAGAD